MSFAYHLFREGLIPSSIVPIANKYKKYGVEVEVPVSAETAPGRADSVMPPEALEITRVGRTGIGCPSCR